MSTKQNIMEQPVVNKITTYVESIGGSTSNGEDGELDIWIHMDNIEDLHKFIKDNYGETIVIDEFDEEPARGFNYPISLYIR